MAKRPYQRLPGRSGSFLGTSTLWEAEDHLLLVRSVIVTETYRRFFFRDIQAIVVCRTKAGLVMDFILALTAAAFGAGAVFVFFAEPSAGVILGVVAAALLMGLTVNLVRGPTCRCVIRTAVQAQPVPSLNRLRATRKILGRLRPKIEAAQTQASTP